MNFYISDLHIGHKNVIMYDNRPYKNVDEMEADIIQKWNSAVRTTGDTVYVLGDFFWNKSAAKISEILGKLNGTKVLIMGNHDNDQIIGQVQLRDAPPSRKFASVKNYDTIWDNDRLVVLSHYPIQFWEGISRGSIHLYGHVHITDEWNMTRTWHKDVEYKYGKKLPMVNVGCACDYMGYIPRSLDEILGFYENGLCDFKQNP